MNPVANPPSTWQMADHAIRPAHTLHPTPVTYSAGNPEQPWPGGTNPACVRWDPFVMATRLDFDAELLAGIEWARVGVPAETIADIAFCEPGEGMISDVITRAAAPEHIRAVLDPWQDQCLHEFSARVAPAHKSPWGSQWWIKRYQPGDYQGMHYDTNSITILGYITDGWGTVLDLGEGRWMAKGYNAGDVACFDGRHTRHAAPLTDTTRIVVGINCYLADDVWRPKDMDELIYRAGGRARG